MNPGYILVVDDEPDIRRLMQEILEDEHYKVTTVEDAAAAREAAEKTAAGPGAARHLDAGYGRHQPAARMVARPGRSKCR